MNEQEKEKGQEGDGTEHTDLLLLDLLHPDWKHFFSRYKTDIVGFLAAWIFVALIFGITIILTRIGA